MRRTQSPTALVNHTQNEENREVSYGRMRAGIRTIIHTVRYVR